MDLALLLAALAADPARIDVRAAWFVGPGAPLVLPVTALPPPRRAARILAETRLPLGERVAAALAWGAAEAALRAAAAHGTPLSADPALDAALRAWAADEGQRLSLSGDATLVAVDAAGRPRSPTGDERGALADVHELLPTLAWPRWRGPLLLVPYGLDHPAIAPGQARVARPALPVLRPPEGGRAGLAVAIAELALALSAPPPEGWPGWLMAGTAGCARARASGVGIPERPLAERRAAAGTEAIRALLAGETPPEPELATAVVGHLLHPARRARLPALLDLLRHGAGGVGAVATAYGLSPAALAGRPADASPSR